MQNLGQRGAIQFIVLLILIAGFAAGLYLVQKTQIFKPKASVSGPISPTTSFVLMPAAYKDTVKVGETIEVTLLVHSDIAAANLFDAKIKFDQTFLAIDQIDYTNSIIKSWVEQFSDNVTGTISLVGGIPNPGLQTQVGENSAMARFVFKVLKEGDTAISFDELSAIYSNLDNANILTSKDNISLHFDSISQIPNPSPEATSEPKICATVITYACEVANASNCQEYPSSCLPDGWVRSSTPPPSGLNFMECFKTGGFYYPKVGFFLHESAIGYVFKATSSGTNPNATTKEINSFDSDNTRTFATLIGFSDDQSGIKSYEWSMAAKFPGNVLSEFVKGPTADCNQSIKPQVTPVPGTGDANGDGKVNLVDLSMLLSDFNKTGGFRAGIDLNGDGVINTFDFSLIRNLLIANKVIRG